MNQYPPIPICKTAKPSLWRPHRAPDGRAADAGPPPGGSVLPGRWPALDGLRGLAVLAVMVYHSGLRPFLPGGYLGVDVFFVLGGFLVTVLLVREHQRSGSLRLGRFYLRRVLRLAPALFLMLAGCCAFAAFRTRPDRAAQVYRAALLTACYAANWDWLWSAPLGLLSHAWSLSVEGQFYLVWPALLYALLRRGAGLRGAACVVAAAAAGAACWPRQVA